MLRSLRLCAIAAILATAGCGSTADDPPRGGHAAATPAPAAALKVAPTDGRVGDATAATSAGGLKRLKVRRRPTDPRVLREGVGAGASCPDLDLMPDPDNLAAVAAATFCLVNGERADAGLPPLSANAMLERSALAHSQDMVRNGYFAHESLDGRDVTLRVRVTGYIPDDRAWTVGENLAWGTGMLATPGAIVQAWMNSQGHRENILRSGFTEAGLGIAIGNPRTTDGQGATYTMNFGGIGDAPETTAAGLAPARPTAAARRAAARRRARTCRRRAAKARNVRIRKARMGRCARAARRAARRS